MPLPCTDIPAPAQGLADHAYDQSVSGRQRRRQRLAQRRRIAAYARLVLAVAEGRRLADAELRDLMNAQPDDARRGDVLLDLAKVGLVRWEDVGRSLELHPGMWEAAGLDRDPGAGRGPDLPLAANQDGCPWTRPVTVDGDGTVVSGHHRAELARQLDLPLAETDGRDAP